MDKTPEQLYTDLLRQLARRDDADPGAVAAAFAEIERMHATGQITDWQLENAREAYATVEPASPDDSTPGVVAGVAGWVADQAQHGLEAAADLARSRARRAVASYTAKDPVRAMLVAAAAGALAMVVVALLARAAVRKVERDVLP